MLETPPNSERSYKAQLYALWKANKEKPQAIIDHPLDPPQFEWIWNWYFEIASPISWAEIDAWSKSSGIRLKRWEGELLFRLDYLRRSNG